MPYTTVVPGTTIPAAWGNAVVRDQVIVPFASVAARDSAITAPVNGQYCTTTDTGAMWRYNGTKWLRQMTILRKPADTTFTSNTTQANDPDLQFPVDANAIYQFVINVGFVGPTSVQYKWTLVFPSGGRMDYSRLSLTSAGALFFDYAANIASGFTTVSQGVGVGAFGSATVMGTFQNGVTPGTVAWQAAQNTSNATSSVTLQGATLMYAQLG